MRSKAAPFRPAALLLPLAALACGADDDAADDAADAAAAAQDDVDSLRTLVETQAAQIADLESRLAALEAGGGGDDLSEDLAAVEADVAALQALAPGVEALQQYVTIDTATNDVVFSGANVWIQDGSGTTNVATGLGNLIVGYAENDGDTRTGSHNVVVGDRHSWTSYGGIVAGYDGAIDARYASVLGGYYNTASGPGAAVLGGYENTASANYATISGGAYGEASSDAASVAGGYYGVASALGSAVSGGYQNSSTETYATVSGGAVNSATANAATVAAGRNNVASGQYSIVVGGNGVEASTTDAVAP